MHACTPHTHSRKRTHARPDGLHEAMLHKTTKYTLILDALQDYHEQGWTVQLFPLVVGREYVALCSPVCGTVTMHSRRSALTPLNCRPRPADLQHGHPWQ
eukprot:CAMPEP_0181311672 /NCGR_PEP_ID=MMETSP1101-20121128/13270_1 /TAXON_ID=46948 /ORGANISM="Rhodomonas abbreviata, Strain Caron Lab Isolate" /LENGTH=99 /DNA_ID=CAMNT_0023418435 /DNA_START=533 /DNA_END=829 /DNA_ORIENTATION=-